MRHLPKSITTAVLTAVAALGAAQLVEVASAADLGVRPATPGVIASPRVAAPLARPWYPGGNTWRGHHDVRWDQHPRYAFDTLGWRAPWTVSPRLWAEPYRPPVVKPKAVAPTIRRSGLPPEPFSAQWYVYCAEKYRSFDAETGLYTTYSGARRTCH
jgi:hypothetical protein